MCDNEVIIYAPLTRNRKQTNQTTRAKMKKAKEEREKIEKAYNNATDLVINQCEKVTDLNRLLSVTATESARLNKQASAILENLSTALTHAWHNYLGTDSLSDTDALDRSISVAADKAAKLKKQAAGLVNKLSAVLANIDI